MFEVESSGRRQTRNGIGWDHGGEIFERLWSKENVLGSSTPSGVHDELEKLHDDFELPLGAFSARAVERDGASYSPKTSMCQSHLRNIG